MPVYPQNEIKNKISTSCPVKMKEHQTILSVVQKFLKTPITMILRNNPFLIGISL